MGRDSPLENNKEMKFKVIHHVDQETINRMYEKYAPVFILSTGRSGSKFVAQLLDQANNVSASHEPRPTLEYFSNYAYHHQQQQEEDILTRMIDAARMESILDVFIKDKIYVESNQCLTFFAPVIARLFRKSKFVHLVRHPGDFARSGVRKGWHKNDSIWESGRVKMADEDRWAGMDQVERLSWLWSTTNSFLENFKQKIDQQRVDTFKFEDLTGSIKRVRQLLAFTGAEEIEKKKIKQVQDNKINELHIHPYEPPTMKKVINFPHYKEWDKDKKDKLRKHCAALADMYGYQL